MTHEEELAHNRKINEYWCANITADRCRTALGPGVTDEQARRFCQWLVAHGYQLDVFGELEVLRDGEQVPWWTVRQCAVKCFNRMEMFF